MSRIGWIDDLKGLAITLIVAGHVVATLGNMTTGDAQRMFDVIFAFIYSFHVPLFFLIAGLTFNVALTSDISFAAFFRKKFLRLMLPYYIWGFASAAVYVLIGQGVATAVQSVATTSSFAEKTLHCAWWVPFVSILHAGTWPDGKGFCFNGVLWFLPVLFAGEIVYYWIARIFRTRVQVLFVFALLVNMMLWLYPYVWGIRLPLGITDLIRYLPFIALGHCLALWFLRTGGVGNALEVRILRDKKSISIGFLSGAAILLLYFVLSYFYPIARRNSAVTIKWFVLTLPTIGILMLLAKPRFFRGLGFLAPLTLGIMLFHKYPLVLAQIALGRSRFLDSSLYLRAPCTLSLGIALFLTLVLTLLCYFISKIIVHAAPWSLGVNLAHPS